MIKEGKIGLAEGFSLLLISFIARIFLADPSLQIEQAKNMAWLILLVGTLIHLFEYWIIITLMKRHQDSTIIEASEKLLGPYLGILFSLLFALYFIAEEAILIRRYSEALITAALPNTPIGIVLATLTLGAVVSCYYGLEVIARVSRVSITFILLGIVILFVTVSTYADLTNFYPMWSMDPIKLLTEGLPQYIFLSEGLLIAVIFHTFGDWRNCRLAGMLAISLGGSIRLILGILLILTFGVELAAEKLLPFFTLSRLVSFGRFFQRAESVFLLTWAMVGFLKLAITLYASTAILARTLRLPDYRPLLWVVSLLCFSLSIIPKDLVSMILVDREYFKIWGLVPTILLPCILLLVSLLRKKEGKRDTLETGK